MRSAASRLRSRQSASSLLCCCLRSTDASVSAVSCADTARLGQCVHDQPLALACTSVASTAYTSAQHAIGSCPKTQFSHSFTSSAEFSGGRFKVSGSASHSDQGPDKAAEEDTDERLMLLEASLAYVVSESSRPAHCTSICCKLSYCSRITPGFRLTKAGQTLL